MDDPAETEEKQTPIENIGSDNGLHSALNSDRSLLDQEQPNVIYFKDEGSSRSGSGVCPGSYDNLENNEVSKRYFKGKTLIKNGTLQFTEDRIPMLFGEFVSPPKYTINERFLVWKKKGKRQENKIIKPNLSRNKPSDSKCKFPRNACWNCGEASHKLHNCPRPRNAARIALKRKEFMRYKTKPKPKRKACWNCGESTHELRDCRLPRNSVNIARNKKRLSNDKRQRMCKRYHSEETRDSGCLIPGQLSRSLRRALGIQQTQLPTHIYNMRRLGYPPGWLMEAKVSRSGITVIESQERELSSRGFESDDFIETDRKDMYDGRKIILFPGFNVPPPPGTRDESAHLRRPPQSELQSVNVMMARLEGRIVEGHNSKPSSPSRNLVTRDGPSPSHTVGSQVKEYEEESDVRKQTDNCPHTSGKLDEEPSFSPRIHVSQKSSKYKNGKETNPSHSSLFKKEPTKLETEKSGSRLLVHLNNPRVKIAGNSENRGRKSKYMYLGTPLLKPFSPYTRTPSAEKFSANVCGINFETYRGPTGNYEKIRNVIRKVRGDLMKPEDKT